MEEHGVQPERCVQPEHWQPEPCNPSREPEHSASEQWQPEWCATETILRTGEPIAVSSHPYRVTSEVSDAKWNERGPTQMNAA